VRHLLSFIHILIAIRLKNNICVCKNSLVDDVNGAKVQYDFSRTGLPSKINPDYPGPQKRIINPCLVNASVHYYPDIIAMDYQFTFPKDNGDWNRYLKWV